MEVDAGKVGQGDRQHQFLHDLGTLGADQDVADGGQHGNMDRLLAETEVATEKAQGESEAMAQLYGDFGGVQVGAEEGGE